MRERGFQWHQTTVSRIERGEQQVSPRHAEALADVLGPEVLEITGIADMHLDLGLVITSYRERVQIARLRRLRRSLEQNLEDVYMLLALHDPEFRENHPEYAERGIGHGLTHHYDDDHGGGDDGQS